ncbi:DUF1311 domain-containing protein (plasmid) [Erwinia billingiae]|uniref:lysozyme inhibitor LprI family protein n=1 Tax=Erwinia billingiae TaxID=182337 RepID=UPI00124946D4|nr:lysozyme inhibitor LprI family protein [Erwinia billingiae]QEW34564.1 DUF1311 domain-containing protein [Erwinia billingiae]
MIKQVVLSLTFFHMTQTIAADCNDAGTQSEMNQCAAEDYKKMDKELNTAYQQTLKKTSGEQKKRLQSAQKKWISYRDADCSFQTYKSSDGTISPLNTARCLQVKTEQRTRELKNMLNCPEGDVSCPL